MRLKLFVVLIVVLGYLGLLFACNKATPNTSRTAALTSGSNSAPAVPDGTDPPHAVDTSGKAIPGASATQPDKPIILAKDSDDPKNGDAYRRNAGFRMDFLLVSPSLAPRSSVTMNPRPASAPPL